MKLGYAKTKSCELRTIVLNPVCANDDPKRENTRFRGYSPAGEVKLGTANPDAWEQFEIGKGYCVDFMPADYRTQGEEVRNRYAYPSTINLSKSYGGGRSHERTRLP